MSKFKVLLLAVFGVFALSAVAASAASANLEFTAETYPVTVLGTQTSSQTFKVESGTVVCKKAMFTGSASGASETLKVTPEYTECEFELLGVGIQKATVAFNGCEYKLHSGGTVDVECPSGKEITVKAVTCEVKVKSQTGLGGVAYTNITGPPMAVEVTSATETISYEEATGCKAPGAHGNGVYEGTVKAEGKTSGGGSDGVLA